MAKLGHLRFRGMSVHRSLALCLTVRVAHNVMGVQESEPETQGNWGFWHLVSNRPYAATAAAYEYGRRFGCEKVFGTPNGGWVLRRSDCADQSLVAYVCLVCEALCS